MYADYKILFGMLFYRKFNRSKAFSYICLSI